MRSQLKTFQLLAAVSLPFVAAFEDTSPFFLITSSKLSPPLVPSSLPSSLLPRSKFVAAAKDVISACASDAYLLVSQPGLHSSDFATARSAPGLKGELEKGDGFAVSSVFNDDDDESGTRKSENETVEESLMRWAMDKCDADVEEVDAKTATFSKFGDMKPKVIRVDFSELPAASSAATKRTQILAENDAFLISIIALLPTEKYTIIYTSTPISSINPNPKTQQQQQHHEHHELRRRIVQGGGDHHNSGNTTLVHGSLFAKYQFFTPAIFMGYISVGFLLTILWVALSAVSSLKVSYGAFEKEMGPAAAKKLQ